MQFTIFLGLDTKPIDILANSISSSIKRSIGVEVVNVKNIRGYRFLNSLYLLFMNFKI